MLVFRKAHERTKGETLRRELRAGLVRALRAPSEEALLPLLLRGGEIEAALEDAEHAAARVARELTYAIARALVDDVNLLTLRHIGQLTESLELPAELVLRRPEGYAYYALDPRDYAGLARRFEPSSRQVTVIGIRSIGTSLSAVVAAALGARGFDARRATVRPSGDPWARRTLPSSYAERLISEGRDGAFVVVDEGPGLSGSSFLSVGEALVDRGIPRQSVTFLCSHRVDPTRLVASDAERRWSQFQSAALETNGPHEGELDLSAGRWREYSQSSRECSPPSWQQRERTKYLSRDRRSLRRFIGYPPYGERAAARAEALSRAGFSPSVLGYSGGYLRQRWENGHYFPISDVRPVERIAEYIAFRARAFPVRDVAGELDAMFRHNVQEATGEDLGEHARLPVVTPTVCDGALSPHEWLLAEDGRVLKTDSCDHGDDHLYPGPCDSAWDLAGAVVEWQLDERETQCLLEVYRRSTGDDAAPRLPEYELAYSAFRIGCMRMAKLNADSADAQRFAELEAAYERCLREPLRQVLASQRTQRD